MIIRWILYVFNGLIGVLLSPFKALSDVAISPQLASAIANVQGIYSSLAPVFPILTLLTILGLVVGIELAILTYKFTMWLVKKIPTIS